MKYCTKEDRYFWLFFRYCQKLKTGLFWYHKNTTENRSKRGYKMKNYYKKKVKKIMIEVIGYAIGAFVIIGLIYLFVFVVGTIFNFLSI